MATTTCGLRPHRGRHTRYTSCPCSSIFSPARELDGKPSRPYQSICRFIFAQHGSTTDQMFRPAAAPETGESRAESHGQRQNRAMPNFDGTQTLRHQVGIRKPFDTLTHHLQNLSKHTWEGLGSPEPSKNCDDSEQSPARFRGLTAQRRLS